MTISELKITEEMLKIAYYSPGKPSWIKRHIRKIRKRIRFLIKIRKEV
jgi:hypothetical protein